MMKKNLLFICDYAAHYTGTFIASVALLAEEARSGGARVCFLFPAAARNMKWVKSLPVEEEDLFWCDFSALSLLRECRKLSRTLNVKDTVVHTHFIADWYLLAIKSVFRNVICHYHMMVPMGTSLMKKVKQQVRRIIYRGVVMIGVSEAVAEDIRSYFWKPVCRCINNAVDFDSLDRNSEGTELPGVVCDPDKFRILIHGSDFYGKGVDVAVKAIDELPPEIRKDVQLFVTSHRTQDAQNMLDSISRGNAVMTAIHPVENIKKLYDSMSLYVSASREESFGYAVVESAYSDCQVAASDIPGQNTMKCISDILWFEKDDVSGLKDVILQAIRRQQDGTAAQKKPAQRLDAVENFRIREWVRKNMDVYETYFG